MKRLLFSLLLGGTLAGCGDDLELLTCKSTLNENAESVIDVIINHDNKTVQLGGFEKEWDATIEDDRISFAFGGTIYTQDGQRKIKHHVLNLVGLDDAALVCEPSD